MGRLESSIQTAIIGYLRGRGAYVYNAPGSASSAKGTPDILACVNGRWVALEIKRPDGDYGATKAQQIRIRQIHKAGGIAAVVTSIGDVATLLRSVEGQSL